LYEKFNGFEALPVVVASPEPDCSFTIALTRRAESWFPQLGQFGILIVVLSFECLLRLYRVYRFSPTLL
jgi:hypothetical protein